MQIRRIPPTTSGIGRRVGVVLSRFNAGFGDLLLAGALRALKEAGVVERSITIATVPGALEIPLVLQRLAQTGDYDALIALGAVVRGETYHFEIVANESARGVAEVQIEFGIPIGNGILTTNTDEQALTRAETKGFEAAQAALAVANRLDALDEQD